jgi:hypothetical protein
MRRPAAAFTRPGSKYGHAHAAHYFPRTQVDRESRGEKDSDQVRGQPNSFDSQVRTCTPAVALAPALAKAPTTATPTPNSKVPIPTPLTPNLPHQDPDTTNLYVGNMSPNITEEFLYTQFCDFGPIQSVKVC